MYVLGKMCKLLENFPVEADEKNDFSYAYLPPQMLVGQLNFGGLCSLLFYIRPDGSIWVCWGGFIPACESPLCISLSSTVLAAS